MNKLVFFSLLLLTSGLVQAQEGPFVPCVGCESLTHVAYPETGSWYNPDQSGSGLNLEIQNGQLLGYYYGYDANGQPQWQIIKGPLVLAEGEITQWELETTLLHFQDGNCIGCEYQPPTGPAEGMAVKLEFQQRNYLRLTIGDNPGQFFVPIIYGSNGFAFFSEQTPYLFPEYGADFIVIAKPNSDPSEPWEWKSSLRPVTRGVLKTGGADEGKLIYRSFTHSPPPGPDVFFTLIECELDTESGQPGCTYFVGDKEYVMPIGYMSDSRFFGEAADGSTIEGYRIDYD